MIGVIDPGGPASVVDEDVESAETFDRALDERLTLCLIGDVALDVVPVGRQRRRDSLELSPVTDHPDTDDDCDDIDLDSNDTLSCVGESALSRPHSRGDPPTVIDT